MVHFDVLIVGGGHAVAQAAITLRQLGYPGTIAIAGEEDDAPYERPPLSKDYLSGERAFADLSIRPASFWSERAVTLFRNRKIIEIDASMRRAWDGNGDTIDYGSLGREPINE